MQNLVTDAFRADLRSLAAFRIGVATLVLTTLGNLSPDITAFYTDEGVLPRTTLIADVAHDWHLSLHLLNGTTLIQSVLFIISALSAFFMLVGYRTRLTTCATWFLLLSLQVRNPLVLNGGDRLLLMFTFWGMFLPLGRCWSVDNWLTPELRAIDAGQSAFRPSGTTVSLATAAIFLQVIIVYLATGLLKWQTEVWQSGDALSIALSEGKNVTGIGKKLLAFPDVLSLLNYATLYYEIFAAPLLLLPSFGGRLRLVLIYLFWFFHLSIWLCLDIGLFPFVSIVGFLSMLPGMVWDRTGCWVNRFRRRFFGPLSSTVSGDMNNHVEGPSHSTGHAVASLLGTYMVGTALAFVLWSNLGTLVPWCEMPRTARNAGELLKLNQHWRMFARVESHDEGGWFVFPGRLVNGETPDLLTGDRVNYDRPELISKTFKNVRWRKLCSHVAKSRSDELQKHFGQYIWKQWQTHHPSSEQLVHLRIYYTKYLSEDELTDDAPTSITVFGETHSTRRPIKRLKLFDR